MSINGGELLVRTLKQAGVEHAFVLHGGHLDPIFQACLDHDLKLIDTRHEAAAGHAADAYARQRGTLGVAIATAGPGYTNVITAITQAYLDCSPVLFIAGAAPLRDAEKWPLQGGIDQVAMAKPVTKWAGQVTRTDLIPHLTAHAIRIATSGRPGPVLLEVPIDVLFNPVTKEVPIPETIITNATPAPPAGQVDDILDKLAAAERPVIVAGGGTLFANAGAALKSFAEASGIPVYGNNKALGMLAVDHPLCGHSLANLGALRAATGKAPDVALFLGIRFGMFTGGDRILPEDCTLIQVDIDGSEFGRLRQVDLGVNADCRTTLEALRTAQTARQWPDWAEWAQTVHGMVNWHETAYAQAHSNNAATVHPYQAVAEVMAALEPGTIVCADGGETSQWAELVSRPQAPGEFTGHGYLGCLGMGMPFAMGSQVANPNKRVVCIVGDGAAGLNIQEFDTMVRHELPVVTVVLNNKAWGMCVHGQQSMYGGNRLVVTKLGESRYDKVAEGFGCFGAFVDNAEGVRAAVAEALSSGRPACVNIVTDIDAVYGVTGEEPAKERAKDEKAKDVEMPYYENLEQE